MRYFASAFLLFFGFVASGQELQLPFHGRWFVMQGGDTPNVNHHMAVRSQAYGIDFAKADGPNQRQLARNDGVGLEDFYSWGEEVLSPADATIVLAVDRHPDNQLGKKDPSNPAGNHVVLRLTDNRFLFLGHMQRGSISVHKGDTVRRGQRLGLCGNSGNSDFPHIHLHIQDTPELNTGTGQNPVFGPINIELTGKEFGNVTWPLIRGLFVWNP